CQRRIWEVVSTCETPQDQRMFLSRLVSLVMVWLREFGGQSAGIAAHYSGYSPAEGTHLEKMPAVGEGTGAAPQSHQRNGDTALAEYSRSGGKAQERAMFPQAHATVADPEWQAEYPAYEQRRISPVHAPTSCGPTYACAIWTSISGAVSRVFWVNCRSRSRIRSRYSLRLMRLPRVVSWRRESTIVRKCSPP